MRHGWRPAGLGCALALVAATTACGSTDDGADARSAAPSSAQPTATAAPGTYGAPVDPSLPEPTAVATDPPVTADPGGTATVVVTYSGWIDASSAVEVGAYVAGVAESGGTCTLTLTSGSASASAEVAAEPDVRSTSCPTMAVAGSELSSGSWEAVVSYRSPSTTGESGTLEVVVP